MNWDKKVSMMSLSNERKTNDFQVFVLENIHEFDSQDWDIFITGIVLTPEEIDLSRPFYLKVLPSVLKYLESMSKDRTLSMSLSFRLNLLIELIQAKKSEAL